jgi:hypothetical protein
MVVPARRLPDPPLGVAAMLAIAVPARPPLA